MDEMPSGMRRKSHGNYAYYDAEDYDAMEEYAKQLETQLAVATALLNRHAKQKKITEKK